ncbi:hypothetical protein GUITHDRAFT_119457 [Guillardia theta CCMP2712]|uniref:Uncharacterized protein n=1 Tax=Guillardia theta (strain CCMP2712) TaxID=905079 RepID=L1IEV7_GUITC|nr:hypothetical protein GUITHDRAFT_119457 [Guillardia theta CCMP2712]EKX34375.1 hypothetical protein GUITHDRAFT_119457 [Guillardia theta CCMP2712]|eukprot:XP_005821355.1 hypothetical protein GUITHDRAFT_119457 [Guillardia theta CCMP2712]
MQQRIRPRGVLRDDVVMSIYADRVSERRKKTAKSMALARKYGVTAKAIRDIWNRRTWWHVTQPLWTQAERLEYERTGPKRQKAGASKPAASNAEGMRSDQSVGLGVRSLETLSFADRILHGNNQMVSGQEGQGEENSSEEEISSNSDGSSFGCDSDKEICREASLMRTGFTGRATQRIFMENDLILEAYEHFVQRMSSGTQHASFQTVKS